MHKHSMHAYSFSMKTGYLFSSLEICPKIPRIESVEVKLFAKKYIVAA